MCMLSFWVVHKPGLPHLARPQCTAEWSMDFRFSYIANELSESQEGKI